MPSIKCGSCKETHESVAQVRHCYTYGRTYQPATQPQKAAPVREDAAHAKFVSDNADFLQEKLRAYDTEQLVQAWANTREAGMERMIEAELKTRRGVIVEDTRPAARYTFDPNSNSNSETFETEYAPVASIRKPKERTINDREDDFTGLNALRNRVEAGRYAVRGEGDEIKFYQVDKPKDGRWAGYTFLNVQASDETFPVRNPGTQKQVFTKILLDPKAAMLLYGREIGRCGHCGRTLTDANSRAAGIGPVCAGKLGW